MFRIRRYRGKGIPEIPEIQEVKVEEVVNEPKVEEDDMTSINLFFDELFEKGKKYLIEDLEMKDKKYFLELPLSIIHQLFKVFCVKNKKDKILAKDFSKYVKSKNVDNVDFVAAKELEIPIANTPRMFGTEVADIAVGYVIGLARQTFFIDRGVRLGKWLKPSGISLSEKTVALLGFGDIGRNTAKRLLSADMRVIAYDPYFQPAAGLETVESAQWPNRLDEADFIVLTCALTPDNWHILNKETLALAKRGLRIVNVARGPLIDEVALAEALASGQVYSVALDVFEVEPLPEESPLRQFEQCIFGSHNASNTVDAVHRASERAIALLFDFLGVS
jgi:D-3-phosphoglycerate dehydrogenase